MNKKVIIASKNPVKIDAVRQGFTKMFPDEVFVFEWVSTKSWVSDQPMSNTETYTWAYNRVKNIKKKYSDAEYWVWIEGGTEKKWSEMESFAWIVILKSHSNIIWKSKTGSLFLPKSVTQLVESGKELWEASDIVFHKKNSKQNSGTTWILTWDIITRTKYYNDSIILALIPFRNSDIYI